MSSGHIWSPIQFYETSRSDGPDTWMVGWSLAVGAAGDASELLLPAGYQSHDHVDTRCRCGALLVKNIEATRRGVLRAI